MTRWRFILPDVLFYFEMKNQHIAVDEPLEFIFNPNGTVSNVRKIASIVATLKRETGRSPNNREIMIEWLKSRKQTPEYKTVVRFVWTLEKYRTAIMNELELSKNIRDAQTIQEY
jgi:hypothetical protein